jgi:hypothetical protein
MSKYVPTLYSVSSSLGTGTGTGIRLIFIATYDAKTSRVRAVRYHLVQLLLADMR